MSILAVNKRARFDYEISDLFEAGIVLFGHEVKAIKNGRASLKGAFVTLKEQKKPNALPELFLTNAHVPKYEKASTVQDYDPDRPRKLLMKKREISRLIGKKKEQGLTLVPIKLYTKHSLVKIEFGIGRGKKKYDKREDIKKRDIERQMRTLTKEKYR